MNAKQKRFCDEYLIDCNATQAAIRAGYSPKTAKQIGQENLTKPDIQKFLQELAEQMASQKIAKAKEMQEVLTSIIRQELDEEVIVVEGCGDGISEAVIKKKKPSTRDAIKAIETLAKMQGLFDTSTNVNLVIPVFSGEEDLEE